MIKDCNQKPAENRHSLQDGREKRGQTDQWDSVSAENIPTHAVRVGEVDCYKEAYCAGAARAAQVMG